MWQPDAFALHLQTARPLDQSTDLHCFPFGHAIRLGTLRHQPVLFAWIGHIWSALLPDQPDAPEIETHSGDLEKSSKGRKPQTIAP